MRKIPYLRPRPYKDPEMEAADHLLEVLMEIVNLTYYNDLAGNPDRRRKACREIISCARVWRDHFPARSEERKEQG